MFIAVLVREQRFWLYYALWGILYGASGSRKYVDVQGAHSESMDECLVKESTSLPKRNPAAVCKIQRTRSARTAWALS